MKIHIAIFVSITMIASSCKTSKNIDGQSKKPPVVIEESELSEDFDKVFNELVKSGFTGAFLIAEKGAVIYKNFSGYTNFTDSLKVNEETIFELASVSKHFTATAIAILEQDGKIVSSDPISKYITELGHYNNITVDHLIHHTGGLPEYDEGVWVYDRSSFITNDSIINYLARKKPELKFTPGSSYEYNNTGYVLLASIVERVSGLTFAEFLSKEIFNPSSMTSTRIHRPRFNPKKIENYAVGFVYSDSLEMNVIPDDHPDHNYVVHLDGIQGDGMVNSTVTDLLKWDRILYTDNLLNDDSKNKVFATYQLTDGTKSNYGYGWKIKEDEIFGRIVNHSGGWPGYVTFIERHLDNDKTIILLQNNYNNYRFPTKSIRSILYKDAIPTLDLQTLVGKYEFEDDKTQMIIRTKNSNLTGDYDGDSFNLIPIKKNVFFIENQQEVEVEFIFGQDGNVSNVKWHQGDYIGNLIRIE